MLKFLFSLLLCAMPALAQTTLTNPPDWYHGTKPWAEIGFKSKMEMIRIHNRLEEEKAEASRPGKRNIDPALARQGKEKIESIVIKYNLNKFYKMPSQYGSKMLFWIPSSAWDSMSPQSKKAVEAYAASLHRNWGIGVGRVKGRDVLSDRVIPVGS